MSASDAPGVAARRAQRGVSRAKFVWPLLILLAACDGVPLKGQLVDALNGDAPLGGEIILAKAVGPAELTCQTLTGTTADDGRFEIPGLCLSQTAYRLEPSNPSLFFADAAPIDAAGNDLKIQAWWVPAADGVHVLRGRDVLALPAHTDLRAVRVGDESVLYPATMPEAPPSIGPADHLVITGEAIATLIVEPLVANDARTFGTAVMSPWSYVGVHFTDDTFERIVAAPDPNRVVDVTHNGRPVRYVAGDAFPPGKYVLYAEGSRRASIVQFSGP